MYLYPAILTDSIDLFTKQIALAQSLDGVEVVQIDVIDGRFADNLTISPIDIIGFDYGELQLDFQLMVEEPLDYLHEIIEYKQQLPIRVVIAQVERMSSQQEFIEQAKDEKIKTGFSLDLFTPISAINKEMFAELDVIQLMSIEAGFQDLKFDKRVFEKIKELNQIKKDQQLHFELIVDGGVKQAQLGALNRLKVDAVAVGSWLWKNEKPQSVVNAVINL